MSLLLAKECSHSQTYLDAWRKARFSLTQKPYVILFIYLFIIIIIIIIISSSFDAKI